MRVTKQTSSKRKAGPSISPGLMKKLEPTLHMKRRKSHSLVDIATIQPLTSELQDKTKRGTGTSTTKDEFTFPSSPERKVAKKTVKDESKTEAQVSRKDLARTRKILKRHVKKEVLEIIKTTRETIQTLRRQLHESKNKSEESKEEKEARRSLSVQLTSNKTVVQPDSNGA